MNYSSDLSNRLDKGMSSRIVIVRSLPGLGDLLCLVPALRALRNAFPAATMTLIGLPQTHQLMTRFRHYIDNWLEFPGYPGIPEVPFIAYKTLAFLTQVQQLKFDLALQMHGNGSCINSFALLLGAKQTAGCYPANGVCPDPNLFLPYPEQEPEIWRHLSLLKFLGIPLQGEQMEFPLEAEDEKMFTAIAAKYQLIEGRYICIHPGANHPTRRWHTRHFATVADRLATQGWQIVLTGTQSERTLTQQVSRLMHASAVNLAGETNLGVMAVLLQRSRLLISNDTGVSHLAAALAIPSVVVFSNSDPHRWAPLDRQLHRVVSVSRNGLTSQPELKVNSDPASVTRVLSEAAELLQQEVAYAY